MSLRIRLLLLGLTGVAVALAVGAVALYGALTLAVHHTLDDNARTTATDVVQLIRENGPVDPLPVSGAQIVQVVDSRGRVVTASANADRLIPVLRPAERKAARAGHTETVPGSRTGLSGPLRVVGEPLGSRTVLVAVPVGDVQNAQHVLRNSLLVTYPVLLVVLALIAWWLIGRTLHPVESLRSGAERISGQNRDERLPVPHSADEIHDLAVTLNDMLDRLATTRARQQQFVADAAHELRSPLASMRTQLEVAQHLGEGGELPAELLQDVARLTALVDDLLVLARLDAVERPHAAPESFDLRALVTDLLSRYAGARVPVSLTPGAPTYVRADPEEVRRIVTNLLDNAVRHANSGVAVAISVAGHLGEVTVSDDGPGIPPEERERVFERFARLDDARSRDAGGTGLGLAIARELARRSGGDVSLDGEPAEGSVVSSGEGAGGGAAGTAGLVATVRLPR
ncbi:MAG TPA: HAMP domain-containing sensor histidine kinase [Segeticoccus sp.]|uniref:sensor histidine kinase n=1 Tax=Segeticoccus sp. TaxID=2706531 RepID=UPI002D7EAB27|nr:HAMP domain-containing sensor histidine kinase [Segeticoccus sp.]HET8598781.1 HAMP domain-containing sensor histidine kinase [Segeticoccus sp.]